MSVKSFQRRNRRFLSGPVYLTVGEQEERQNDDPGTHCVHSEFEAAKFCVYLSASLPLSPKLSYLSCRTILPCSQRVFYGWNLQACPGFNDAPRQEVNMALFKIDEV